jgi:hypothetical protein
MTVQTIRLPGCGSAAANLRSNSFLARIQGTNAEADDLLRVGRRGAGEVL